MNRKNVQTAKAVMLATALASYTWVSAGSLSPPAGAIAPTMKTLSEVEPRIAVNATNTPGDAAGGTPSLFKISQPGSYYLTGNVTGVSGKYGIEITASGVTLDLNGFDMVGVPGSQFGIGVSVSGLNNIAVVNGSVRSWGFGGVNLSPFIPPSVNCRVEGVIAAGNSIVVGDASTVAHCSATGGGIGAGKGSTVTHCSAQGSTGDGIIATDGSTVSNCSASNNSGYGIYISNGSTVSHSSASGNANGIGAIGGGCMVINCSSSGNSSNGILSEYSAILNSSFQGNTLDGIRCTEGCLIRENNCYLNGNGAGDGAGIHTTGFDNRIEGNQCTGADRGIDVDAAKNIIMNNTCSNNTTNWTIAANNVCGPILNRTSPGSAAISGNSAPSSLGTTEPNANFTY